MNILKRITLSFIFFLLLPIFFNQVSAITFDLIAPEGQLHRGDQVQFTINIDSEGSNVTSTQIGVTYDNQYLQFVTATPGAAMNSVSVSPQDAKNFILTGTSNSGFNGKDVFSYLNFTIIADAPGSAQVCSLWGPSTTPTLNPTNPAGPTSPQPTGLPRTGDTSAKDYASVIGSISVIIAGGLLLLGKIIRL